MRGTYLIPANTKKGILILGIFRPFDLILFGSAVLVTILLLMLVPLSSLMVTVLVLAPALICSLLIMPVPYYHNILTIIIELYQFIMNRQKYIWKGWCVRDEQENKEQ